MGGYNEIDEIEKEVMAMYNISPETYVMLNSTYRSILMENYVRIRTASDKVLALKKAKKQILGLKGSVLNSIITREYQKRKMIRNNYLK